MPSLVCCENFVIHHNLTMQPLEKDGTYFEFHVKCDCFVLRI